MRRTVALRAGILVATCAAVVAVFAAPAGAHVTVTPSSVEGGDDATIAFNVPNEEDKASTVKLEVSLPVDQPVANVNVRPVPGWTATTQVQKLATPITSDDGQVTQAVSLITWVAQPGQGIKPGEFQEFEVALGPLPASGQMILKAVQTYSNGDVVRWIDETKPGQAEPAHPAPVLTLTKADAPAPSAPVAAAPAGTGASTAVTDSKGSGAGVLLGLLGLIAGIAALVVAIVALRRTGARPTA
jgi:periplasmic copper chaperone A